MAVEAQPLRRGTRRMRRNSNPLRCGTPDPRRSVATCGSIGRFERELGAYILGWLSFDGPSPADLYGHFGITVERAVQILLELADVTDTTSLAAADLLLLSEIRATSTELRLLGPQPSRTQLR